jgi:hypothetical protein
VEVGNNNIKKAGPDRHQEKIVSYRREEDATYTKVTQVMSRDHKTGQIKILKRIKPVEEGPYELTSDLTNYDERMPYQEIDGSEHFLYFVKRKSFKSIETEYPPDEEE